MFFALLGVGDGIYGTLEGHLRNRRNMVNASVLTQLSLETGKIRKMMKYSRYCRKEAATGLRLSWRSSLWTAEVLACGLMWGFHIGLFDSYQFQIDRCQSQEPINGKLCKLPTDVQAVKFTN